MSERATGRVRRSVASSSSSSSASPSSSSASPTLSLMIHCHSSNSINRSSRSSSNLNSNSRSSSRRHSSMVPLCLATILITLFIACGRIASADAAATAISANAPLTVASQPRQTWRYFTFDNAGVCFHRCDANHGGGGSVVILFSFSKHRRCFAFENARVFSAICESRSQQNHGLPKEWKSVGRSRINCTTRIKSTITEMPLQFFQFVRIVFSTNHHSRLLSLSNMSDHRSLQCRRNNNSSSQTSSALHSSVSFRMVAPVPLAAIQICLCLRY
jgi:hypothetical protein